MDGVVETPAEFMVECVEIDDVPTGYQEPEAMWRVRVLCNGEWQSIGKKLGFASERDAVLAMQALLAAGINTIEKLREAKPRWRQIMCEALPW